MGDACSQGFAISCELYVSVVAHSCLLTVPTPVAGPLEVCCLPSPPIAPSDHPSCASLQVPVPYSPNQVLGLWHLQAHRRCGRVLHESCMSAFGP